jgi:hypothetical protein
MSRIIPDLPLDAANQQQQVLIAAYNNSSGGIHELSEKLEELESHMAICKNCTADETNWVLRALLIRRIAECAKAVDDYGAQLGWKEN